MSAATPPTAVERLAASRERLRQALQADAASAAASPGTADLPAAALLLDAVGGDWAKHPLALAVDLGGQALRPLAGRHPWLLVGGAALLGAGVVWQPRSLLRPALLSSLLPLALKALGRSAAGDAS